MNADNLLSRIPARYWGYLALSLWGGTTLFLLPKDPFNLEEGAAKALLLAWSMADGVASSAVTFNTPDLRALLFLPISVMEPGSIFAAKVFTVLSLAVAACLLYLWERGRLDAECALLATGLLLVSPLTLQQIDTISPGVYLLLALALGAWLNEAYRANPRTGGGWYFSQLLVSAFSVSLHPAGLAYPLALLWSWHKEPLDNLQKKYFFIGVSFIVLFTLFLTKGWHNLEWLQNPIKNLAAIMLGASLSDETTVMRWMAGGFILLALVTVILKQFRDIWSDFTGRALLIGLALGATTSDPAWAMIALCLILYFGIPLLLRSRQTLIGGGFMQQRGVALLSVFILFTLFMQADKAHYEIRQSGILSTQDQLIKFFSEEVDSARKAAEGSENGKDAVRLRVASQWPGRTMIACKCDTLPLPPPAQDAQAQLNMLRGINYLLFDPQQPSNAGLAHNLSLLGGEIIETIALQPGGVLLHFRNADAANPEDGK